MEPTNQEEKACEARPEGPQGRAKLRNPPAYPYERHLQTKTREVTLKVPKLRTLPFETASIERYRRRESSVEEALVEMYLAGLSVRRVEDNTEVLWGTRVSPSTVSELNQKIYAQIEAWRNGPIGEVRNVSLLVAIGVNDEGFREVLAVAEGSKEDKASRGVLSGGAMAAVRSALLPECVDGRAHEQSERSGGHAESDSRAGRPCSGTSESGASGCEIEGDEAGRRCGAGTNRD